MPKSIFVIAPEARVDMEEGTAMGGKENVKVAREEGVKVDGQVGAELEEVDGDVMARDWWWASC